MPASNASPPGPGSVAAGSAPVRVPSSPRRTKPIRSGCSGCNWPRGRRVRSRRTPRATRPRRPCSRVSTSSSIEVSRYARACNTNAGWPSTRTSLAVAEPRDGRIVVAPVVAHANPQFEEHAPTEQALDATPRRAADRLQGGTAGADHDCLLAVAFDPDDRADTRQRAFLYEPFDLDGGGVRQFRGQTQHELLADQFGN